MAKFEEQLTALETVVEKLERGELSLDESVALFEEGVRLSTACKKELDSAEGRIQALTEVEGDGEVRDLVLTGEDEDEFVEGEDEE
jgi:exodeoxyribonuclease VII small subunit